MDPRYPIGKFAVPETITSDLRAAGCAEIASFPSRLREAAAMLTETQLETSYREGGWTARQVIHHVADSHMNSYIRFRLALTENAPIIKLYDEALWAELSDARLAPIEVSLGLIDNLHYRWSRLLQSMTPADFARTFRHPDLGERTLDATVQLYAWHGRHHLAHLAIVAGV
jgi:uncharacterized damage-inducible protein DinB